MEEVILKTKIIKKIKGFVHPNCLKEMECHCSEDACYMGLKLIKYIKK